ncbi:hypothetical protein M9H77_18024 [Catharanthus roseus]|uniref:Uncharacterized protein n=1 Tax=Catharanthus roseus TaxID=4058 RepID=A0ACC0B6B7_CATRO|nr:hypothetical protein M9H77_18024 [Catharanthus roseus]
MRLLTHSVLPLLCRAEELNNSSSSSRKMNGYSRIRKVITERSKSIDFSHLSSSPPNKQPLPNHDDVNELESQNNNNNSTHLPIQIQEHRIEDTDDGEIFGVILSRKCSISSNPSNNFISEKQSSSSSSVHSALKRTLSSIKRSSSVSGGGYCRIHHQCDSYTTADDNEDIFMLNTFQFQTRSTKKKGKFFEACKRILGF